MRENDLVEDREGDKAVVREVHDDGYVSVEMDCRPGYIARMHESRLSNISERVRELSADPPPRPQWCPVCRHYHVDPGEKTDAGGLVRQCPLLPDDDPRNKFENFPLTERDCRIVEAARTSGPRFDLVDPLAVGSDVRHGTRVVLDIVEGAEHWHPLVGEVFDVVENPTIRAKVVSLGALLEEHGRCGRAFGRKIREDYGR